MRAFTRGLAAASLGLGAGLASAQIVVPDATEQLEAIQASLAGYSTVMWAIALVSVGILVGVKWIKRGKGAS